MIPDYAMYTEAGNAAVDAVVKQAQLKGLSWSETYQLLCVLSEDSRYAEATDTAVRECAYAACNFDCSFYL